MYIFSPRNFTYRPTWQISLRMNYMVKFFLPSSKTTRFILYSYCCHGSSEFHVVQVRTDNFSKLRNNHFLYSCLPICGVRPICYFFVLYLPFVGCPHKYLSEVGEVWIITKIYISHPRGDLPLGTLNLFLLEEMKYSRGGNMTQRSAFSTDILSMETWLGPIRASLGSLAHLLKLQSPVL